MVSERSWWMAVTGTGAPIVVVGAGVAGSTAALVAARHGREVVLIDRARGRRPEHGETLPPEAKQVLLELGVWEAFVDMGCRPCMAYRSVWGTERLHTWEQLCNPHGIGWHVERHRLEALLREAAIDAGARSVSGVVVRAHSTEREIRIVLECGTAIEAGFVVDGSGRSAVLARQLGATRVQYDHLVGLVLRYGVESESVSLVEAVPDGWWYSAPTPAGLIVIMFGDADLVDWRRDPAEWLDEVPHTRARVAMADLLGEPTLVAASTSALHPLHGNNWVAVGDAAATFDPLGSHGLLHGLISGREAVAGAIDAPATLAYAQQERSRFDDHIRERRAYFRAERRWEGFPFWRRRAEEESTRRRTAKALG
jgi:flavin-dependent dehydrogenase